MQVDQWTSVSVLPVARLPLEVRCQIYRYAMGAVEFEIGDRRALRRESITKRYHRFALSNFTINYFSLLRSSTQIRQEVQTHALKELSFTIMSINALEGFLGYRLDYPGVKRNEIDAYWDYTISPFSILAARHNAGHDPESVVPIFLNG